jgi:hypothetical protein
MSVSPHRFASHPGRPPKDTVKRLVPLIAAVALAATVSAWPAAAGLPISEGPCADNSGTFSHLLRVDRARLKTHKQDRRLVEVVLKNTCKGYGATGWGMNPVGGDNQRVMIVVGPGVKVDWKGADLDRYKIPRTFQWQGGGGMPGGSLAGYTCQFPSHLVTKDKHGKIKVVPYHPDTSGCSK